jgi:hypothetical protein
VGVAIAREPAGRRASNDNRAYLDELWQCLPAFAVNAAGLPAEERGSFEWLAAAGRFWWVARESAELSREEAATTLGCSVYRLRLLEFGLVTPRSFSSGRWRAYASQLGDAGLYDQYRERFER